LFARDFELHRSTCFSSSTTLLRVLIPNIEICVTCYVIDWCFVYVSDKNKTDYKWIKVFWLVSIITKTPNENNYNYNLNDCLEERNNVNVQRFVRCLIIWVQLVYTWTTVSTIKYFLVWSKPCYQELCEI